jgi:peptidoglycan/LPS O-acetylase OafA/YrhL/lysophospholipase L1-like esterase
VVASDDPGSGRRRIPALDGLRGLAVAGVLAFHTGAGWAKGGFLGVSAFFTLSGFLICRLLLEEHAATGRISLPAFWARRARRLLPASLVALLGVVAFGTFAGSPSSLASLRVDVVAALAYVANWRFVASSQSYAELFRAPSAAQHFWSLAIEEQCYVAFPLVLVVSLAAGRRLGRPHLAVAAVLAALFAASLVAAAVMGPPDGADPSRAYYGTDVRAAELLVGAGLAVALTGARGVGRRLRTAAAWSAPLVLGAVLWSWVAIDRSDVRLYDGGLVVHALAVAVLIVAAHGTSAASRVLAVAPLRWLGRISYGAYLYHWPLFLWLTPARVGVDGWALSGVRLAVTLALATASVHLLEEPVRTGRWLRPTAARGALVATMAAVVGAVALAPTPATPSVVTAAPARASIATVPVSADAAPARTEPLRVYVAGDSVALRLGLHLQTWGVSTGRMRVWAGGWLACAAARGGTYRYAGVAKRMDDRCNQWAAIRGAELDEIRPDVVVVSYGVFDVLDRRLPGRAHWQHVGEAAYDEYLRSELVALQELLQSRGARVVWLTSSYLKTGGNETGYRPPRPFPEWDHARVDRFNALVREVAATSGRAAVLDLQAHLRGTWGDEEDVRLRPDGVHPSVPASDEIAGWLGPQLLADG